MGARWVLGLPQARQDAFLFFLLLFFGGRASLVVGGCKGPFFCRTSLVVLFAHSSRLRPASL